MKNLRGKKALITGASSGIGRAIALALSAAGVELAVSARRHDALEALADEIAAAGRSRPVVLTADLSVRGEAASLAARAVEKLDRIDILVNNAGIGIAGTQANVGDDELARTLFETNYFTPLALTAALVPAMRERGAGAVVNITSVASVVALPLNGHYASSKAALARATEALAQELRGSGVDVLHVLPGPVETAMLAELRAVPGGDRIVRSMPRGTPEILARKIVRGLERGRRTLVYPGSLAVTRHLPTVAQAVTRVMARGIDTKDERKLLGGSAGSPLALEVRAEFERRAAGAQS